MPIDTSESVKRLAQRRASLRRAALSKENQVRLWTAAGITQRLYEETGAGALYCYLDDRGQWIRYPMQPACRIV